MDVKEKFLDALVDTYYQGHNADELYGLNELIYEVTDPYCQIICELLGIDDDEYMAMLDEALTISYSWRYNDLAEQMRGIERMLKKD